ncbi:MAG: hypothetical protein HRU16_06360, partial [Planctomycetes bacterium]|nr:hypothetical protein [Planctomycetota bacterium]
MFIRQERYHGEVSDRPRLAQRIGSSIEVAEPGRISPLVQRWFLRGPFGACFRFVFRPRCAGWEHLPKDRPVLIVSNHSGGGAMEIIALSMLWNEEFGDERRVTGLAHPMAWYLPGPSQTVQALGAVPSTYEHGLAVLEQGIPTIIFP